MSEFADEGVAGQIPLEPGSKIVMARGTEEGLTLRIDGRAEWQDITSDVETFLGSRRKFFQGGEVAIEWLDRLPTKDQSKELEGLLREEYGIEVIGRKPRENPKGNCSEAESRDRNAKAGSEDSAAQVSGAAGAAPAERTGGVTIPLFTALEPETVTLREQVHVERMREQAGNESPDVMLSFNDGQNGERESLSRMTQLLGEEVFYDDDANAKIIFGTLRSGQRIETPFSLVVIGDVNPGADLIAGGDIIVFGSLRGTAHASAYDDETPDRVIVAVHMQPIQLRIGSVISRGSDEIVGGAEIARIEDRRIVVEEFNPRANLTRKFRALR